MAIIKILGNCWIREFITASRAVSWDTHPRAVRCSTFNASYTHWFKWYFTSVQFYINEIFYENIIICEHVTVLSWRWGSVEFHFYWTSDKLEKVTDDIPVKEMKESPVIFSKGKRKPVSKEMSPVSTQLQILSAGMYLQPVITIDRR